MRSIRLPEDVIAAAAEKAGVPDHERIRFGRLLENAVNLATQAHTRDKKRPSRAKIVKYLSDAKECLEKLLPEHPGEIAGTFLRASTAASGEILDLSSLINDFELAIYNVTENPRTRLPARGRPKGTTITAFDILLTEMLPIEVHCRFMWTAHAGGRVDTAQGSLVAVLSLLESRGCLPVGIIPGKETLVEAVARKRSDVALDINWP